MGTYTSGAGKKRWGKLCPWGAMGAGQNSVFLEYNTRLRYIYIAATSRNKTVHYFL